MSRKMKDSGVEWIGEIPENWSVCKTLNCLVMPITDGPHTTPELFDEGIPFISAEAVSCGNGSIDFSHMRGYISREFYDECCKKYIPEIDDIYMIKSGATTGKVSIVDTDKIFTIWSPLAVFRCNKQRVLPKFMFYFLQSYPYQKQVELGWSYGTQQNIGMRALEKLKVFLPPIEEQSKISDKIDKKCSQIDALISNQQKQIEKLKQYKQSLITEAVTKGLNPDVEMKDSGIEWIGEIPSEWSVHTLKSGFLFGKGLPITKADLVDNGTAVISYGQIHAKYNCSAHTDEKLYRYVPDIFEETHPQCFVSKDDFIFADTSEDVAGSGDFVYIDVDEPIFAGYHTIILKSNKKRNNRFLAYLFMSDMWKNQIQCRVSGVKLFSISKPILGKVSYILPLEEEQGRIADFLESKCKQIDSLIAIKEQKIEKLNKYKKSIIYEYVTGKKEA